MVLVSFSSSSTTGTGMVELLVLPGAEEGLVLIDFPSPVAPVRIFVHHRLGCSVYLNELIVACSCRQYKVSVRHNHTDVHMFASCLISPVFKGKPVSAC